MNLSKSFFTIPEFDGAGVYGHAFFTKNIPNSICEYAIPKDNTIRKVTMEDVVASRTLAMQQINMTASQCSIVKQIHSNICIAIDKPITAEQIYEADAQVTKTPSIVLGALTADCVPILLADRDNKIIGAAHSGWKGSRDGIIESTINNMIALGARNIVAAIGPCIRQSSYEISEEFYQDFINENPENKKLFIDSNRPDHYLFDLPAYVKTKLKACNVDTIYDCEINTYTNSDSMFSYRLYTHKPNVTTYGSLLSVIWLR